MLPVMVTVKTALLPSVTLPAELIEKVAISPSDHCQCVPLCFYCSSRVPHRCAAAQLERSGCKNRAFAETPSHKPVTILRPDVARDVRANNHVHSVIEAGNVGPA